jgi:hypothetical protein
MHNLDNDNTLLDGSPSPDELKQKLETMPFEKLQKIALDIQEMLGHKNVPASLRPVIVAVINELQRRKELLEAESIASSIEAYKRIEKL